MEIVDHERMSAGRTCAMSLPQMFMAGSEVIMAVCHQFGIARWPKPKCNDSSDARDQRGNAEGGDLTYPRPNLPHKRIADQPETMAERKLRGINGGPVFGIGRTTEEAARWGNAHRIDNAQGEPARQQ